MLSVTNQTDATHKDRYNGHDYEFPPGVPVVIEEAAARLFFGLGEADLTDTFRRNGWMKHSTELSAAKERLNGFKFDVIDAYRVPGEGGEADPAGKAEPSDPPKMKFLSA